jgi:hypothetical protein
MSSHANKKGGKKGGKKEEPVELVHVTAVKKGSGHGEVKPQSLVASKHAEVEEAPVVAVEANVKKEKFDAKKSLQTLLADQDKKAREHEERAQHHKHIAEAKRQHEAEVRAQRKREAAEKAKNVGAEAAAGSPAHVEVFHSV